MPDIKRTRKGRPGPKAQRSALIVARGKSSGRDATVQPKRKESTRVKKDTTTVLEAGDSVESFLERAKRETETYETARGLEQSRAVFVDPEAQEVVKPLRAQGDALFRSLPVPRRPAWDEQTSKDQLTEKEEQAFLQWRRGIAATEEAERSRREKESLANSASVATPFERNLEVWRQLWRTLERSDCVLLIVDARWPDLYAPPDLVDYARSLKRGVQVVVNKADYLSPSQREVWRRHFRDTHGLETIFFSARREQAELDEAAKAAAAEDASDATGPADAVNATTPTADGLASRHDLLNQAEQLARTCRLNRTDDCEGRPLCVGMVGYPNVGKSSCVNVLRNASKDKHGVGARAAVSATPGKTKHLQTLLVRPGLELCDCPGLVFPALVTHGAAELLCAGVVPIARMRDPTAPASLVAARTPRALFDALYGTHLSSSSEPLTANEALEEVCRARDYTCGGSNALDLGRAGRLIVKAYVDGDLLYCHAPPSVTGDELEQFRADTRSTALASASVRSKVDDAIKRAERGGHHHARVLQSLGAAGFSISDAPPPPPVAPVASPPRRKKDVSNRSNHKHGKKGRKQRDKDPYGNYVVDDDLNF
jgi:large subunit GTPase 1